MSEKAGAAAGRAEEGEKKTIGEILAERDRKEREAEDKFKAGQLGMSAEKYENYKKSAREYDMRPLRRRCNFTDEELSALSKFVTEGTCGD